MAQINRLSTIILAQGLIEGFQNLAVCDYKNLSATAPARASTALACFGFFYFNTFLALAMLTGRIVPYACAGVIRNYARIGRGADRRPQTKY